MWICGIGFKVKGRMSDLEQFLATESPLKMMQKCFSFHLKSSFRSQDIEIFDLMWPCIKTAWSER